MRIRRQRKKDFPNFRFTILPIEICRREFYFPGIFRPLETPDWIKIPGPFFKVFKVFYIFKNSYKLRPYSTWIYRHRKLDFSYLSYHICRRELAEVNFPIGIRRREFDDQNLSIEKTRIFCGLKFADTDFFRKFPVHWRLTTTFWSPFFPVSKLYFFINSHQSCPYPAWI